MSTASTASSTSPAAPGHRPGATANPAGAWLVVGSAVSIQAGQALAKVGFAWASPVVLTSLRFALGALVLWALFRPRLPGDARTWGLVLALGVAAAGANLLLYESAARVPLGVAVTVQFLGALAVALAGARRARHAVWAVLAVVGVALINHQPGEGGVSRAGLALAVASAACFGAYILLAARVGARTPGVSGLTWATAFAAVLTLPLGVAADPGAFLDWRVLLLGLAAALLCSVLANSLEIQALRLIPTRTFGVLVSLEPAAAGLAGLVLLGERLSLAQWLAIAAIVTASAGSAADASAPRRRGRPPGRGQRTTLRAEGVTSGGGAVGCGGGRSGGEADEPDEEGGRCDVRGPGGAAGAGGAASSVRTARGTDA